MPPLSIPPAGPRRRGAAAVEFAVVAPVLILLVFGSIDFGRAMMVSNLLTNAAREGARLGAAPNVSTAEIRSAVTANLNASGITTTHAQIAVLVNGQAEEASTATTGTNLTVSVTVPFADVTWLPTSWFLQQATLGGRAVMRRE